jgi:vacuolar-type H+-ATPase subunit I/STV1
MTITGTEHLTNTVPGAGAFQPNARVQQLESELRDVQSELRDVKAELDVQRAKFRTLQDSSSSVIDTADKLVRLLSLRLPDNESIEVENGIDDSLVITVGGLTEDDEGNLTQPLEEFSVEVTVRGSVSLSGRAPNEEAWDDAIRSIADSFRWELDSVSIEVDSHGYDAVEVELGYVESIEVDWT